MSFISNALTLSVTVVVWIAVNLVSWSCPMSGAALRGPSAAGEGEPRPHLLAAHQPAALPWQQAAVLIAATRLWAGACRHQKHDMHGAQAGIGRRSGDAAGGQATQPGVARQHVHSKPKHTVIQSF